MGAKRKPVRKKAKKNAKASTKAKRPGADLLKAEVDTGTKIKENKVDALKEQGNIGSVLERALDRCPYCESKDFVKRGIRANKHQQVQLFVCRNLPSCGRTFTSRTIKGKQFPWPAVLDAISYYNLGYTFEQVSKIVEAKHGVAPQVETISKWYEEYKPLCRFERLRPYAVKILAAWRESARNRAADIARRSRSGNQGRAGTMSDTERNSTTGNVGIGVTKFDMVETTTLAHRQLYRFRYHRPKLLLMLEEYKNRSFGRLTEYLDAVATETPHQYFQEGERMSEIRSKFDKADMIVKGKRNFANRLAEFVLQGVPQNKDRHEELQRFLIANDSVTVATEVPVYIRREDVAHMEQVLKFKVTVSSNTNVADIEIDAGSGPGAEAGFIQLKGRKRPVSFPKLLTGHIDLVQVRNGQVHLLDYKPNAAKEKPIEQLTWYALALSRLTGLRLFEFKCAWFDENEYFEFYPLHVVKKLQQKRKRKVRYIDGSVAEIPKENELSIIPYTDARHP